MLKLLNAMTNENIGRTYLLKKQNLIDEIVYLMMQEVSLQIIKKGDTDLRQNCLGIIQKFTLRSEPQKKLIELDTIKWIVSILISEADCLTEYTLEYGLALLMNLSLRVSGRDKCEQISKQLIKLLMKHINNESIQVRTCINGTLYSLFKRKKLKVEARNLGVDVVLKNQLENPNELMKKQIQYILDEINDNTQQEEAMDEDFDDEGLADEEEDANEEEYIEDDSIDEETLNKYSNEIAKFKLRDDEYYKVSFYLLFLGS
jgi:hypothetical protein